MKTMAIIDLDTKREHGEAANKMVVNNEQRAKIARQYADQFSGKEQTAAFFEKIFDPSLIKLDVIESQAQQWLEMISARGAEIMYLTSRPHTMKAETEKWLKENSINFPCVFKDYGTGEIDQATGKLDTRDKYVKTPIWKANQAQRLMVHIDETETEWLDWVIFADDEEENRRAVAAMHDPRILIRCSLEDAATHDFQRHKTDESTPPFLRRLQELASILEQREAFEKAEKWEADISHPLIPGQQEKQSMIAHIEAWNAAAYAPFADPGERYYRYSELYPQTDQHGENELICALEITCDQAGRVASVKMAQPGPNFKILKLEEKFDMSTEQDKAQEWADEWIAQSIEEFGYVEAAKAQRGMQLVGKPVMDAYLEYVRMKNEEIKAALRGKRQEGG